MYTISHITNNFWAQEAVAKHLLLRNPRGWLFKIKRKKKNVQSGPSRSVLGMVILGIVHSRNSRIRNCGI
jgi:hypothetical protein